MTGGLAGVRSRFLRRRLDRASLALGALTVAAMIAFLALPTGSVAQGVLFVAWNAVPVALLVRAWLQGHLRTLGQRLLVVGAAVYGLTNILWTGSGFGALAALPYPSPVDIGFLVSFALFGAFLLSEVMARPGERSSAVGITLDAAIVAAAGGSIIVVALIEPVLHATEGVDGLVIATSIAFPVAMVVLLALVMQLLARTPLTLRDGLILTWVGGEMAGNMWYSKDSLTAAFVYGQPSFLTWIVSYGALALFALRWVDAPVARRPARSVPPAVHFLLITAALVVPGVLVVTLEPGDAHAGLHVSMLAGMAGLVLLRVFFLLREVATEKELRLQVESLARELEFNSRHDALTGLANRPAFDEALGRALARRARDQPGVLLVLDLDGFKAVNDAFGHEVGDEVLRAVADRLRSAAREADVVARLGGDEFAIVAEGIEIQPALRLAERLGEALVAPLALGPVSASLGVSIGIYPLEAGDPPARAMRRADASMYVAKAAGGGLQLFDEAAHSSFMERHELLLELRTAIREGQLLVHYQTVIELAGRTPAGAEALVRWQHPTRGLLMPGVFIEMAEESGAVVELGRIVLETACRDAAAWQSNPGLRGVGVSVNLSRRQLRSASVVDMVAATLASSGLDPRLLTLEVTETALMADQAEMIAVLDRLHGLGVTLAMDDFGTGYSSLSQLRRLPIDILKIDRAFVTGIAREEEEWSLAVAIVRLAASLNRRLVAEGVEEPAQMVHLRSLGVDYAQGYLFSRPVPFDQFVAAAGPGEGTRPAPTDRSASLEG